MIQSIFSLQVDRHGSSPPELTETGLDLMLINAVVSISIVIAFGTFESPSRQTKIALTGVDQPIPD